MTDTPTPGCLLAAFAAFTALAAVSVLLSCLAGWTTGWHALTWVSLSWSSAVTVACGVTSIILAQALED